MGGSKWTPRTIPNLKAFLAMTMYMDMKKQPNIKTYWEKCGLFHCPIISNIMTQDRFYMPYKGACILKIWHRMNIFLGRMYCMTSADKPVGLSM